MNPFKSTLILIASTSLIFLGACNNTNPTPIAETTVTPTTKKDNNHGATKGGQVVETGKYHLEFVPEKEANQTHMDLYLLTGDSHATVPNAKVTAQVQLPDGKQQTIPFT